MKFIGHTEMYDDDEFIRRVQLTVYIKADMGECSQASRQL